MISLYLGIHMFFGYHAVIEKFPATADIHHQSSALPHGAAMSNAQRVGADNADITVWKVAYPLSEAVQAGQCHVKTV